MRPRQDLSAPVAAPAPQPEASLLIADVAALTGVPAPQLRSWEQAGILHPRRSPNGMRLYGVEDVARVRLIKRSLVNPGRRGSLRRLAAQLARGDLLPAPEDYAGLVNPATSPVPLSESLYWRAVVDAMEDLVVVCDTAVRMTYANAALRALLAPAAGASPPARAGAPEALPAVLEALPLRWAAHTGTHHHEVDLVLRGPDGAERPTLWTVTPLRGADGALHGAVGVGREPPADAPARPEDWLAMAAHDLRGSVTSILGRLEIARRILAEAGGGAAARQETAGWLDRHLAVAELSTVDLIRTMETQLDASAAAAGALVQHLEPGGVALDLLAREAVGHAEGHTTRHAFTLDVPAAPLLVAGDRVRLRQVLDNLLANAIKYAPDGGPIAVQLEVVPAPPGAPPDLAAGGRGPGWALLRVADSGLGIPEAALPHVFERYWRAGGATRLLPGSGLGLYTCRAIVAAHGGHIWVERSVPAPDEGQQAVGWHGTVMAVALPLASPAALAAAAATGDRPGPPVR